MLIEAGSDEEVVMVEMSVTDGRDGSTMGRAFLEGETITSVISSSTAIASSIAGSSVSAILESEKITP